MSQTVTNLTAGKTGRELWYGSAGKTESGRASIPFDQALISMMAGVGKSQEGLLSVPLLVLGELIDTGDGAQTESSEDSLAAMIEGLLQQLDKLDDALQEDPSLLAILQGWLSNVQNIAQSNPDLSGNSENAELSALAGHPETMRFAVQDALTLLLANPAQQSVSAEEKGLLLESLQSLLAELPTADSKGAERKSSGPAGASSPDAAAKANDKQVGELMKFGNQQTASSNLQDESRQSKVSSASASFSLADDASNRDEGLLQPGNIVTAGQLALRDNGIAPLKLAAPPIPVENFAKEMSGFMVSKLEIVNLKGISEAKISLYPEHLGQVDVKITMQGGQLVAQFVTEHAFAKESLEQQMAQLRSALQQQGLQVGKLEVTQNSSLSSHMYHDGRQPGSGSGQQQNGKRRVAGEETAAINDVNDEWNDWISEVRAKEQGYGSSFVARA